jgi:hypothetical protein
MYTYAHLLKRSGLDRCDRSRLIGNLVDGNFSRALQVRANEGCSPVASRGGAGLLSEIARGLGIGLIVDLNPRTANDLCHCRARRRQSCSERHSIGRPPSGVVLSGSRVHKQSAMHRSLTSSARWCISLHSCTLQPRRRSAEVGCISEAQCKAVQRRQYEGAFRCTHAPYSRDAGKHREDSQRGIDRS